MNISDKKIIESWLQSQEFLIVDTNKIFVIPVFRNLFAIATQPRFPKINTVKVAKVHDSDNPKFKNLNIE